MAGPIEQAILDQLAQALDPSVLEVINESHMHSGPALESHFKVVVVAEAFADKPRVQRHRMVNRALAPQLDAGLHALSIVAHTPAEWEAKGGVIPASPPCGGASKSG